MSPEAWVALGLGLTGVLGSVLVAVWILSAQLSRALARFELVGTVQANEIKEIKLAVQKLDEVVSLVAVQRDQIQSLRETQILNTKRTDDTFTRIFTVLDNLRN